MLKIAILFIIIILLLYFIIFVIFKKPAAVAAPAKEKKCVEPEDCINARYTSADKSNISYDYINDCPANCVNDKKIEVDLNKPTVPDICDIEIDKYLNN